MQIGIGLPAGIPGVEGSLILDWARKADAGPFSTLGILDRLVYPNFEPMVTLGAAAAVTRRIRLMTGILIAPLRNAGILAKQAATLDALSGGRLVLGLAVGWREDDYRAAPASYKDRGQRFEEQLTYMKRIWTGQPLAADIGAIGPPPVRPGGPEVLIAGHVPAALRRVARWGDGFLADAMIEPARVSEQYRIVEEAWRAEGRSGKPRFVGAIYFALGPNAAERAASWILNYYDFLRPLGEKRAKAVPSSPKAIKEAIQAFADIGTDELVLWPCIPELDQVDRLAEVVG